MKFEYSPGLIGYGAVGIDGSAGLQGAAIYFTDRNPLTDEISINNLIENNEILWTYVVPGTKLPSGRTYNDGDVFIDFRGFIYKINLFSDPKFINTEAVLNKSTFFYNTSIDTNNEFRRWQNMIDVSSRYLIDNRLSPNLSFNYSQFPLSIYGILMKDFARIEHKDSLNDLYDGFSLYSSGVNVLSDDNESFGIVRDVSSNTFRIGNLDDLSVRNTNLNFDVNTLLQKRENSNLFNKNTPSGTVLTNMEISTNLLFDPGFDDMPASFNHVCNGPYTTINWVLNDFTQEQGIKGRLVFGKTETIYTWSKDASSLKPMIFYNLDSSGSLSINGLVVGRNYKYYMVIESSTGWERTSQIKTFEQTGIPGYMNILDPVTKQATATNTGVVTPSTIGLDTNSPTGWNAFSTDAWINITGGSSGISGPGSFGVTTTANTGYNPRIGSIKITSEAPDTSIGITQARRNPINHTVRMVRDIHSTSNATAHVEITPPLDIGQSVTLTGWLWTQGRANGSGSHTVYVNSQITLRKNSYSISDGSYIICASCHTYSTGPDNYITDNVPLIVNGIGYGDSLQIYMGSKFEAGYYTSGTNAWWESWGHMRLDSVYDDDGYDTFTIDPTAKYWDIRNISYAGCGAPCYNVESKTSSTDTW
jgi:hypothetical protein